MTFEQLYGSLVKSAVSGKETPENLPQADPKQMERLLHPQNHAPVWAIHDCTDCGDGEESCGAACLFNAIGRDPEGKIAIDPEKCSGCGACLEACKSGTLTASRDILPALSDIKNAAGPVYALVAPSFLGQFSPEISPGKLRSAFLALGFSEMLEVALFADVLTLKEALAFNENIHTQDDFQLTSCCCPVWISMIKDIYHELIPHMPGAVSPMIAAGRTVKALHPDALTVFIGPCLAKKSEAREPELAGAIDWVLTFREMQDIFNAADIHPEALTDTETAHSSRAGRIYGRAGGVSEAVQSTVARLHPEKAAKMRTSRADGVPACKEMVERLKSGRGDANYYEGMGCPGGCVGGPRAVLNRQDGRENVNRYGDASEFSTPLDNPYVTKLLNALGFDTVGDFLENSHIYSRNFTGKGEKA